jgi:hypothetical protein
LRFFFFSKLFATGKKNLKKTHFCLLSSFKKLHKRTLVRSNSSNSNIAGFSLGLEVDPHLERLVLALASSKRDREQQAAGSSASASLEYPSFLLPPRDLDKHPPHSHPLTVVLDLDGTLIASYPPSRAGALLAPRGDGGGNNKPPAAFLVGQGSRLNPSGVLVLERPGLGELLAMLSEFAEVVLFTGEWLLFFFDFEVRRIEKK